MIDKNIGVIDENIKNLIKIFGDQVIKIVENITVRVNKLFQIQLIKLKKK
jgi:hypothetical protein